MEFEEKVYALKVRAGYYVRLEFSDIYKHYIVIPTNLNLRTISDVIFTDKEDAMNILERIKENTHEFDIEYLEDDGIDINHLEVVELNVELKIDF